MNFWEKQQEALSSVWNGYTQPPRQGLFSAPPMTNFPPPRQSNEHCSSGINNHNVHRSGGIFSQTPQSDTGRMGHTSSNNGNLNVQKPVTVTGSIFSQTPQILATNAGERKKFGSTNIFGQTPEVPVANSQQIPKPVTVTGSLFRQTPQVPVVANVGDRFGFTSIFGQVPEVLIANSQQIPKPVTTTGGLFRQTPQPVASVGDSVEIRSSVSADSDMESQEERSRQLLYKVCEELTFTLGSKAGGYSDIMELRTDFGKDTDWRPDEIAYKLGHYDFETFVKSQQLADWVEIQRARDSEGRDIMLYLPKKSQKFEHIRSVQTISHALNVSKEQRAESEKIARAMLPENRENFLTSKLYILKLVYELGGEQDAVSWQKVQDKYREERNKELNKEELKRMFARGSAKKILSAHFRNTFTVLEAEEQNGVIYLKLERPYQELTNTLERQIQEHRDAKKHVLTADKNNHFGKKNRVYGEAQKKKAPNLIPCLLPEVNLTSDSDVFSNYQSSSLFASDSCLSLSSTSVAASLSSTNVAPSLSSTSVASSPKLSHQQQAQNSKGKFELPAYHPPSQLTSSLSSATPTNFVEQDDNTPTPTPCGQLNWSEDTDTLSGYNGLTTGPVPLVKLPQENANGTSAISKQSTSNNNATKTKYTSRADDGNYTDSSVEFSDQESDDEDSDSKKTKPTNSAATTRKESVSSARTRTTTSVTRDGASAADDEGNEFGIPPMDTTEAEGPGQSSIANEQQSRNDKAVGGNTRTSSTGVRPTGRKSYLERYVDKNGSSRVRPPQPPQQVPTPSPRAYQPVSQEVQQQPSSSSHSKKQLPPPSPLQQAQHQVYLPRPTSKVASPPSLNINNAFVGQHVSMNHVNTESTSAHGGCWEYELDVSGSRREDLSAKFENEEVVVKWVVYQAGEEEYYQTSHLRRVHIPAGIDKPTIKCEVFGARTMVITGEKEKQTASGSLLQVKWQ